MEISTPSSSSKPLSITPGSRVLRSHLTDEQIWKRLRDAGFDEESIRHKDKAALVAYIAKLESEVCNSSDSRVLSELNLGEQLITAIEFLDCVKHEPISE